MIETLFLACFAFGAVFTIASVVLGHVGGHGHASADHGAGVLHGHGDATTDHSGLSLFNLSSIVIFLTWFGGAGLLLTRGAGWPGLLAAICAIPVGIAGGYLVNRFLRQVQAGERVMDPSDYRLEGTIGQVSVSIPPGGTGEVVFSKAGARRSEAARAEEGQSITRGTEVVITAYDRGFATVQPWADLLDTRTPKET